MGAEQIIAVSNQPFSDQCMHLTDHSTSYSDKMAGPFGRSTSSDSSSNATSKKCKRQALLNLKSGSDSLMLTIISVEGPELENFNRYYNCTVCSYYCV